MSYQKTISKLEVNQCQAWGFLGIVPWHFTKSERGYHNSHDITYTAWSLQTPKNFGNCQKCAFLDSIFPRFSLSKFATTLAQSPQHPSPPGNVNLIYPSSIAIYHIHLFYNLSDRLNYHTANGVSASLERISGLNCEKEMSNNVPHSKG